MIDFRNFEPSRQARAMPPRRAEAESPSKTSESASRFVERHLRERLAAHRLDLLEHVGWAVQMDSTIIDLPVKDAAAIADVLHFALLVLG